MNTNDNTALALAPTAATVEADVVALFELTLSMPPNVTLVSSGIDELTLTRRVLFGSALAEKSHLTIQKSFGRRIRPRDTGSRAAPSDRAAFAREGTGTAWDSDAGAGEVRCPAWASHRTGTISSCPTERRTRNGSAPSSRNSKRRACGPSWTRRIWSPATNWIIGLGDALLHSRFLVLILTRETLSRTLGRAANGQVYMATHGPTGRIIPVTLEPIEIDRSAAIPPARSSSFTPTTAMRSEWPSNWPNWSVGRRT